MRISIVVKQLALRSTIILLVKVIGAAVRIPVFQLLGPEGVGLYQILYSTYGFILTVVTGGFPTALALATSGNLKKGMQLFKTSLFVLILISGLAGIFSHLYAYRLAGLFGEPRLENAFRYLSPVIIIVPLLSLIRGYVQGVEWYGTIAVSELIEQIFRLLTMFIFISFWIKTDVNRAVGGVLVGALAGAVAALIFMVVMLIYLNPKLGESVGKSKRRNISITETFHYFKDSYMILLTRLIIPFAEFFDAIIIPRRLQASGLGIAQATSIYGQFSGLGASIVYFPSLLTASLSHIFVSKLSSDWHNGRYTNFSVRSQKLLQMGWLWGIGSAFFLFYYHRELSRVIFHSNEASAAIAFMCLAPLFTGLRELSTTILWASERKRLSVIGLVIGEFISVVAGYYLIANPEYRFFGITAELLLIELIAAGWNIRYIVKDLQLRFSYFSIMMESIALVGISFACYKAVGHLVDYTPFSIDVRSILIMLGSLGATTLMVLYRMVNRNPS